MVFPENLLIWMKSVDKRLDVIQEAIELNDKAMKLLIDRTKGTRKHLE